MSSFSSSSILEGCKNDDPPGPGRLAGKVTLITGGGRGIGRAIAIGYAREGARVAVAARSEEEIEDVTRSIRSEGGDAIAIRADVSVDADVPALVRQVTAELGPIEILVNNAARITPGGLAWEVDPTDWLKTIDVNLGGTVRRCRAVVPGTAERGQGKVINVSSGAGENVMLRWSAYCASKAAMTHYTRYLAAETQRSWDRIDTGELGGEHPRNLKRQVEEG